MKLIYEPTIVEAWWTVTNHTGYDLEEYTGIPFDKLHAPYDGDAIPEIAGRVCYQSFKSPRPGGNEAYLRRILSENHGSVLAHASIGFIIHGVSRSLTHELIRHSTGAAISELSQRFVDASDLGFVVPPYWIGAIPEEFTSTIKRCSEAYAKLSVIPPNASTIERKRLRESARSVLPNSIETHIVYTANLRAWRNIMEQRAAYQADLEIRRLAVKLLENLKLYAPNVFQDMSVFVDEDGIESIKHEWRKV